MVVWTEVLDESFSFPHIDIYQTLRDGELRSYVARGQEGYVLYNPNANNTEMDPDTMEEVPVTYYYVSVGIPATFNFDNFPYVAKLRSEVDENYIFGGGDNNDHEVM